LGGAGGIGFSVGSLLGEEQLVAKINNETIPTVKNDSGLFMIQSNNKKQLTY
jgi:hypothetical protein